VPLSTFDGVDYVALGHIHGRQQLSDQCGTPARRCTTASAKATSRAGRGSSSWMPQASPAPGGSICPCRGRCGRSAVHSTTS
jgi:exonuclease SbcD